MQFISNGPDIPEALLQAHEEGRVVFFCGAGISYPAGLPGFEGLVKKIYALNNTQPSDTEAEALGRQQFDATLDLLERRLPGQRLSVRRALAETLKPKLRRKGATATHEALLELARVREGTLRLVTTNFDRVFHTAAKRSRKAFHTYAAPMLPIPKNSRWDGLVYLHGLLSEKPSDAALNRLVVTSGDFGLAYLTERWAARFVSELFRNYVVCFVGYSINDPVLRYMMDALAADRMQGEITPQAWALGDCAPGQELRKTIEWQAKGVSPILYEVPAGTHDHSALHRTLHTWAEVYRDGVLGKERIVVTHALARPSASTQQDDFVGRVMWALSDRSGLPAKRFAEFNPAPPLDWLLEAFAHQRFLHGDLVRFGVPPSQEVDTKLRFSLTHRPAPYDRSPRMALAHSGDMCSRWDDVMANLAPWLVRHLNDPNLAIWIAQCGGQIHEQLVWLIERELDRFAELERAGNISELDAVRAHAPNAIPGPLMRTIWRLLLSGRVKSAGRYADLYRWRGRLKREGLTATLRFELRELLAPKITLRKPYVWGDAARDTTTATHVKELIDYELVLAADHLDSSLRDIAEEHWAPVLPLLLEDIQQLVRDALELQRELGDADDQHDTSFWDLPSIAPHWQNRGFRDWVILIEILRDAWLGVRATDNARASHLARTWFDLPYATFKRLALFAASQKSCIDPEYWVNWLLADDAWWLWSICTKRETSRLLALQGGVLAGTAKDRLEVAILNGPPREMYRTNLKPDEWEDIKAHEVWFRLAKLEASGSVLGSNAAQRFVELSQEEPHRQLASNESDEFSHWMSGSGDPDFDENVDVDFAPRTRRALVEWLTKDSTGRRPFSEDNWRDVCRTRFFRSLYALRDLAEKGIWPMGRWREALQVWSEDDQIFRSWSHAAPLVVHMPDELLKELAHGVTWWMERASKLSEEHEKLLLTLSSRVMALPLDAGTGMMRNGEAIDQPVTEAINHPIGHVAQALINHWFKKNPNDNDRLPVNIKSFLTELCDPAVDRFRHGRVLLSAHLIALFRVDSEWTQQHLLPLLDWETSVEARALWEGFLWSPRLYQPLLVAFKPHFLECARHYDELGDHQPQYAAFLTYAALGPVEGFSEEDFRAAISALPLQGLEQSARALSQALEGAANQREDYWKNRVQPFWKGVWPKSRDLASSQIAESLARVAVSAGSEFPSALKAVRDWLRPVEHPGFLVDRLRKSSFCSDFPAHALAFLDALISDQPWIPSELAQCLDEIARADPSLAQDFRFVRLREIARRRGW